MYIFRYQLSKSGSEGLTEIRWLYPIQGIPESKPVEKSHGVNIECKARDRVEERLEVTLSGVAPSSSGPQKSIFTRSITPKNQSPKIPDGIVVGESKLFSFVFFQIFKSNIYQKPRSIKKQTAFYKY